MSGHLPHPGWRNPLWHRYGSAMAPLWDDVGFAVALEKSGLERLELGEPGLVTHPFAQFTGLVEGSPCFAEASERRAGPADHGQRVHQVARRAVDPEQGQGRSLALECRLRRTGIQVELGQRV